MCGHPGRPGQVLEPSDPIRHLGPEQNVTPQETCIREDLESSCEWQRPQAVGVPGGSLPGPSTRLRYATSRPKQRTAPVRGVSVTTSPRDRTGKSGLGLSGS